MCCNKYEPQCFSMGRNYYSTWDEGVERVLGWAGQGRAVQDGAELGRKNFISGR